MTLLVMILHLTHQSIKFGGYKSCGSRDIIQVGRTVGRQTDMIILLQSVETQSRRFFLACFILQSATKKFHYYKLQQVAIKKCKSIRKCDRLLLQSVSCVTKVRQTLLQSVSGITKCESYYKVSVSPVNLSSFPRLKLKILITFVITFQFQT